MAFHSIVQVINHLLARRSPKSSESGYILRTRSFIADTVVQRQNYASQGRIPRNWDLLLLSHWDSTLRSWIMSFFAAHMDPSPISQILLAGKTLNGHRPPESYTKICGAPVKKLSSVQASKIDPTNGSADWH
jgi:hypothetical protein